MRITVQVGAVAVRCVGLDMTARQVTALLRTAAALAASLAEPTPEEPERQPMGFTVITDRDTEGLEPESRFTDDD